MTTNLMISLAIKNVFSNTVIQQWMKKVTFVCNVIKLLNNVTCFSFFRKVEDMARMETDADVEMIDAADASFMDTEARLHLASGMFVV